MSSFVCRILFIALLIGAQVPFGNAEVIVNTGPGSFYSDGYFWGGLSLGGGQSLAGQFITTQDYLLTDVRGWMDNAGRYYDGAVYQTFAGAAGDVAIALYSDNGGIPGGTRQVLGSVHLNAGSYPDWYGLSGLSFFLAAGTHWVAFEPDSSFLGTMPSWSFSAAGGPYPKNPETPGDGYLTGWAGSYLSEWWAIYPNLGQNGIGVQIEGDPAQAGAVPEPASLWLITAGLAAAALLRKRIAR